MNYAKHVNNNATNQTEQIFGRTDMVQNNAGGYVFQIDDLKFVKRFAILGTEGGTYYQSEKNFTVENAQKTLGLIKSGHGKEIVDILVDIAQKGKARKPDAVIFILSLVLTYGTIDEKQYANANFNNIVKYSTQLYKFAQVIKSLRGTGRVITSVISNWYTSKKVEQLAYQAVKYQSRVTEEGNSKSSWTHRDLLRIAHVKPFSEDCNSIFKYMAGKYTDNHYPMAMKIVEGYEKTKTEKDVKRVIQNILDYRLTHEMIPTEFKSNKDVQWALLQDMGIIATIRNLASYTKSELFSDYNTKQVNFVIDKMLNNKDMIHPLQVLDAMKTYASGHSAMGSSSWTPVQKIVDALDTLLYSSFESFEPTGKKIYYGIDISGSMSSNISGSNVLSCREVTAVLALLSAKKEKDYIIKGFTSVIADIPISPKMRLDKVIDIMENLRMGSTDCAVPIVDAIEKKCFDIDAFVILTDNETYYGDIHPVQAIQKYRKLSGNPNVKLVVVSMTASEFSIADPLDTNMMDIVGASTDTGSLIADFISDK